VGGGDKDLGLILFAAVGFSFGSQMGDIAESAIKRRYDIKDSSNLIPGHGGVLDRFDGMIGAGLIATLLYLAFNIVMAAQ
jgi:phosphatidate cytidylyltransferase